MDGRHVHTCWSGGEVVSYVHLNPVAAGIVDDPVRYPNSGHREIVGCRSPRLVDVPSVLAGFEGERLSDARDSYCAWVRAVAEAKWAEQAVEELPWWTSARDQHEVVPPGSDSAAHTFDGRSLDELRPTFSAVEFIQLFERCSGHLREDLASPLRTPELVEGRIELTFLAVSRYGVRSREIADLINKHSILDVTMVASRCHPSTRRRRFPRTHEPPRSADVFRSQRQ